VVKAALHPFKLHRPILSRHRRIILSMPRRVMLPWATHPVTRPTNLSVHRQVSQAACLQVVLSVVLRWATLPWAILWVIRLWVAKTPLVARLRPLPEHLAIRVGNSSRLRVAINHRPRLLGPRHPPVRPFSLRQERPRPRLWPPRLHHLVLRLSGLNLPRPWVAIWVEMPGSVAILALAAMLHLLRIPLAHPRRILLEAAWVVA
jgi:hypothetical protein